MKWKSHFFPVRSIRIIQHIIYFIFIWYQRVILMIHVHPDHHHHQCIPQHRSSFQHRVEIEYNQQDGQECKVKKRWFFLFHSIWKSFSLDRYLDCYTNCLCLYSSVTFNYCFSIVTSVSSRIFIEGKWLFSFSPMPLDDVENKGNC